MAEKDNVAEVGGGGGVSEAEPGKEDGDVGSSTVQILCKYSDSPIYLFCGSEGVKMIYFCQRVLANLRSFFVGEYKPFIESGL